MQLLTSIVSGAMSIMWAGAAIYSTEHNRLFILVAIVSALLSFVSGLVHLGESKDKPHGIIKRRET